MPPKEVYQHSKRVSEDGKNSQTQWRATNAHEGGVQRQKKLMKEVAKDRKSHEGGLQQQERLTKDVY